MVLPRVEEAMSSDEDEDAHQLLDDAAPATKPTRMERLLQSIRPYADEHGLIFALGCAFCVVMMVGIGAFVVISEATDAFSKDIQKQTTPCGIKPIEQ